MQDSLDKICEIVGVQLRTQGASSDVPSYIKRQIRDYASSQSVALEISEITVTLDGSDYAVEVVGTDRNTYTSTIKTGASE